MNDYRIKDLYEQMEIELIASMRKNLNNHLKEEKEIGFSFTQWQAEKLKELKRYQNQNEKIIKSKTKGLNKKISDLMHKQLKEGSINAIKEYNKLHKDSELKPSKIMNKSFFQINDKKVDSLIKVVNNDLNQATASALRMTNDQYREVIHKSAFFNANGVMTEKQAVDMANRDFLARGLNCIEYKDGKRVNIASYAQMAIRTASLRAHLMGEGDFRKSINNPLVIVTTHGTACKLCTVWQGKVLIDDVYSGGTKSDGDYTLLSEAMKQGFLHPNCRHGITTYYPELEEDDEDIEPVNKELEDLQQQYNYVNRNIKKYKRFEYGSLDSGNAKKNKTLKERWMKIRNNVSDTIHDIRTNEHPPLKIDQLPTEHYSKIKDIIDNAPTSMKKLINDNFNKIKFENIQARRPAGYVTSSKSIRINLKDDRVNPRGTYKSLFHELSHSLDHILGIASYDKKFEQLLKDDFNDILQNYKKLYNVNDEQAYKGISKSLKKKIKMNSISDLIGGITNNKCIGKGGHDVEYWKDEGTLTLEAFAHFGSASIRQDKEELYYITEIFPNAYEYFKEIVKRSI